MFSIQDILHLDYGKKDVCTGKHLPSSQQFCRIKILCIYTKNNFYDTKLSLASPLSFEWHLKNLIG